MSAATPTSSIIYSLLMRAEKALTSMASRLPHTLTGSGKTRTFIDGHAAALRTLLDEFRPGERTFWFHCSSLGEYAIARPLIAELKRREPGCTVLLTFFSSTGVTALARKPHQADFIGYLPPDTPTVARRFMDHVRPAAAIFMVSEYWPNYLAELHRRGIATYLVSALFTHRAPHFHSPFGALFRQSLETYTRVFALNQASVDAFAELGFHRAELAGDPLMDNALAVAATEWKDERVAQFAQGHRVCIAGSITDQNDVRLVAALVNAYPAQRFVLAPHEVDEAHLTELESALVTPSCRLSQYAADKMTENVLIVDNIGSLAKLYRYGVMAYIGGGFTRKIHSMIEATVYGLPTSFGPHTERKVTPEQLCALDLGTVVKDETELKTWYERHMANSPAERATLRERAAAYCRSQAGATQTIVNQIIQGK
jgi:3-deoxy-D-manno-octulosonic-acid transferase